jgi:hypothetical protein
VRELGEVMPPLWQYFLRLAVSVFEDFVVGGGEIAAAESGCTWVA